MTQKIIEFNLLPEMTGSFLAPVDFIYFNIEIKLE